MRTSLEEEQKQRGRVKVKDAREAWASKKGCTAYTTGGYGYLGVYYRCFVLSDPPPGTHTGESISLYSAGFLDHTTQYLPAGPF